MNKPFTLSASLFLLLLSGCTARGDYTCGVPNNGVRCQPMNDTHSQLYDGSLNSLHTDPFPDEDSDQEDLFDEEDDNYYSVSTTSDFSDKSTRTVLPSIATIQGVQAILSSPREMRIWFDRFTDPDGDLHDESFVFIRLDNGHWMIDNKPVLY